MPNKVTITIDSCYDCPNVNPPFSCDLADKDIDDLEYIPDWCPLLNKK